MRRIAGFAVFASVALISVNGISATLPGGITDDYLHTMNLEKVSVGFNFEDIERYVEIDGGMDIQQTLSATSYSLFLGYDLQPWFTAFGTLGQTESDADITGTEADDDRLLKWSLGLNGNLYKWDFRAPRALMGDRLTIKCFAEYAHYQKDQDGGEVEWNDTVLALPIAYERYERNPKVEHDELFRLAIFVGPILSLVDGTIEYAVGSLDFEQSESLGLVAGADVYFTSSVSVGGQVQMYDTDGDDIHARASFRYHF